MHALRFRVPSLIEMRSLKINGEESGVGNLMGKTGKTRCYFFLLINLCK
jgi:hypothetical protein